MHMLSGKERICIKMISSVICQSDVVKFSNANTIKYTQILSLENVNILGLAKRLLPKDVLVEFILVLVQSFS